MGLGLTGNVIVYVPFLPSIFEEKASFLESVDQSRLDSLLSGIDTLRIRSWIPSKSICNPDFLASGLFSFLVTGVYESAFSSFFSFLGSA